MLRVEREAVLDGRERETLERLIDGLRDCELVVERPTEEERRVGVENERRALVDGVRPMVCVGVRFVFRRMPELVDRDVVPRDGSRETPPLERRIEFERPKISRVERDPDGVRVTERRNVTGEPERVELLGLLPAPNRELPPPQRPIAPRSF